MRLRLLVSAAALLAAAPAGLIAQQPAGAPPAPSTPPPSTPAPNAAPTSLAPAADIPLDRLVAVVGEVVITQSDLRERLIAKRQEGAQIPTDSAAFVAFSTAVLGEIVDEELMLRKGKELKVELPESDVTASVDQQYKAVRSRFGSEAEFKGELAKAGYGTPEEYKKFVAEGIRRNELISRTTKKLRDDGKMVPVNVTDADVKEAFDRNKAAMPKREPSVSWRQIIVAPKASAVAKEVARARAESLLKEIKAGGDFEKLAKRESADSGSRDGGGDLGWTRRGKMVPEFDRWLFGYYALQPGQLSPVVETPFGYHIIRVDRINAAEVKSRHILITPKIDSADVARARLEADTVLTQWRAGTPFDTLAKKHHDFRALEETTLLTPLTRAQLPAQYQKAFENVKPNDIVMFDVPGTGNIPIKVVVAQPVTVDPGGEFTLAEMKERFRSRLAEEGGVRRLLEGLRKQTYVSVRTEAIASAPLPAAPAQ
ncbi:MAG: peptidylprolyl isomerase [Gemmatimonadaceae bacterium]